MNMIRHNHVAPNRNIKFALRAMSVLLKSKLGAIHRGNTSAVASRKSDEVEWLIDVNQIKSMRTVLDHSSNCRGSRVGRNNLDSAGYSKQSGLVKRDANAESEPAAGADASRAHTGRAARLRRSQAQELRIQSA